MGGSFPAWGVLALGVGLLISPTPASAQLLDRTSRTVRTGGAESIRPSSSSSSSGRSRSVLDRTSSTVRGGSSSSSPPRSSPPRSSPPRVEPREPRSVQVVPPPRREDRPQREPTPAREPQYDDRSWDGEASGYVGWSSTTVIVDQSTTVIEGEVEAPIARDPMLGGSAGVRATGHIGIPPPRAADPMPAATASDTVVVAVVEEEAEPEVGAMVGMDAGYVIGNVARGTLFARLRLPFELEAYVDYIGFLEPNDDGFDALALGRLGVAYAFVDDPGAHVSLGVALRHFQDWIGPQFGIDGRLSIEVEVMPWIVLTAEGSIGTVGDAYVVGGRVTLGGRLDAIEVFAGYEQIAIQSFDASLGGVDLGGPLAGVRVWID